MSPGELLLLSNFLEIRPHAIDGASATACKVGVARVAAPRNRSRDADRPAQRVARVNA